MVMMNDISGYSWQMTAWCGMVFKAPAAWRIVAIEKDYLLLADDAGPVMELKLGHAGHQFSHQEYLQRIKAGNKNRKYERLQAYPIPPDWLNILRNKNVSCFRWQSADVVGKGVILHEAKTRRVVLVQFYLRNAFYPESLYSFILASLHDQTGTDPIMWSVFNIRAGLPKAYTLDQYRFEPGYQALTFRQKRQSIELYCWGPASTLLKDGNGGDLITFAFGKLALPKSEPVRKIDDTGRPSWEWSLSVTGWNAIWRRWVLNQPCVIRTRLWHLEAHNRILAVTARASRSFDTQAFENICSAYDCI